MLGLRTGVTVPRPFCVNPVLTANEARVAVATHTERELIVGTANCDKEQQKLTMTPSYTYKLLWRVCPVFQGQEQEQMEGLVDAHTGKVYSFVDKIHYLQAKGGVFPISNVRRSPGGVEQPNWPMPYMYGGIQLTNTIKEGITMLPAQGFV